MHSIDALMVLSTATLVGLALVTGFAAWAWAGWLRLRARELETARMPGELPAIGARIDLADLKERIRKLEAIASGVEF